MLRIRKSALAKEDLIDIWLYGFDNLGEAQADFYLDQLEVKINSLGEHPKKYRLREQYSPPIRVCPHQSHHIIYTIENDAVYIVRVLGGDMLITEHI